jgi:hypothetical protein
MQWSTLLAEGMLRNSMTPWASACRAHVQRHRALAWLCESARQASSSLPSWTGELAPTTHGHDATLGRPSFLVPGM